MYRPCVRRIAYSHLSLAPSIVQTRYQYIPNYQHHPIITNNITSKSSLLEMETIDLNKLGKFDFKQGQKLVLELIHAEVLEGEFLSGSEEHIDLRNVFEYNTRNSLGCTTLSFYRSEINAIHLLLEEVEENILKEDVPKSTITISKCEYERLKNIGLEYTYMATMDKRYNDAVDNLLLCENIGVVWLGKKWGRSGNVDLLVITSWDHVYLFDLLLFNKKKFPMELRALLQMKGIKKVMHDSRPAMDHFYHKYGYTINNLFDTQVADVKLQRGEKGSAAPRNIGECLSAHFHFPTNLLESAMGVDLKVWGERPLSDGTKAKASQLAVYLITLKNYLEREMLRDFYASVNKFSKSTLERTAVEAEAMFKNCSIHDDVDEEEEV